MTLFGRHNAREDHAGPADNHHHHFWEPRRDRVAGGHKATLTDPNSTSEGRHRAKHELRMMGRQDETHVPLMTKIRQTFGIRSSPRRTRGEGY